jgi:hypothetical protein
LRIFENGLFKGGAGTLTDITERKIMELDNPTLLCSQQGGDQMILLGHLPFYVHFMTDLGDISISFNNIFFLT